MKARKRVAIVGGGLSGLAAAYELAVHHPAVQFALYEASDRLGGIIETVRDRGFTIECGPDSWVTEKPWARLLVEELGLADQVIFSDDNHRRTYLAQDRALVPMPDGMRMMVPTRWEPLLHSPLLSWQAKQAYLREPKRADELKASALLLRGADADESVEAFVSRHFGEEATKTFAGPLLSGVFGGDIRLLSARSVMAPFVKMEAESGSLIRALQAREATSLRQPGIFSSLKSGLGAFVDRLSAALPAASIRMMTRVQEISRNSDCWKVITGSGEVDTFDGIFLATPSKATRMLLRSLREDAADNVSSQLPAEATSAVCVALGFLQEKAAALRVPRGFGFLVPEFSASREGKSSRLLAATFVNQKFEHRAPHGAVLLRGFFGGEMAESLAGREDSATAEETRIQLSMLLGPLPVPDVVVVRHWPESLPQYHVGHLERIRLAESSLDLLPGLHLIGNAYYGVGLPDLVRDVRASVQKFLSVRVVEAAP